MGEQLPNLLLNDSDQFDISRRSSDPALKQLRFNKDVKINGSDGDRLSRRRGSALTTQQEYHYMRRLSPAILEHLPSAKREAILSGETEVEEESKDIKESRINLWLKNAEDRRSSLQALRTEQKTFLSPLFKKIADEDSYQNSEPRRASASDALLDKPLSCTLCSKRFKYISNLKTHSEVVHKKSFGKETKKDAAENPAALSNRRLSNIVQCEICSQVFKYAGNLESHMKAHRNETMQNN